MQNHTHPHTYTHTHTHPRTHTHAHTHTPTHAHTRTHTHTHTHTHTGTHTHARTHTHTHTHTRVYISRSRTDTTDFDVCIPEQICLLRVSVAYSFGISPTSLLLVPVPCSVIYLSILFFFASRVSGRDGRSPRLRPQTFGVFAHQHDHIA